MGELCGLFRWELVLLKEVSERGYVVVVSSEIRKHLFGEGIAFDASGGVAAVGDDGFCLFGSQQVIWCIVLKGRDAVFDQPVFGSFYIYDGLTLKSFASCRRLICSRYS